MNVTPLAIPEVLLIQPQIFGDARGFFFEGFQATRYEQMGMTLNFVQDNFSRSQQHTLRGLHFQHPHGQGKLVGVISGAVLDVAVDIRHSSPTFGQWVSAQLDEDNHQQLYIPPGFAHGFCVLSPQADFYYKCTDYYHPETEQGVCWDDPQLQIPWPTQSPLLSEKDQHYPRLSDIPSSQLPSYSP